MTFHVQILFVLVLSFALCFSSGVSIGIQQFAKQVINIVELGRKINENLVDGGLDAKTSTNIMMKMLDASAKIPSGLMIGNAYQLGSFDECYGIQAGDIYGKYCLGTVRVDRTFLQLRGLNHNLRGLRRISTLRASQGLMGLGFSDFTGLHFGVCVPSNMAAEEIPGIQTYSEDFCYSRDAKPELSAGALATIIILIISATAIAASTVLDIILLYKKQTTHEMLLAFSLLSNGRKIFSSSIKSDQLVCIHGLRAISMMWVILGHEYTLSANGPMSNALHITQWKGQTVNMIIIGSTVSVDTFFAIGGLLTVYIYLKTLQNGEKFNIWLYWIHRIIRLTPALTMACLIYMFLVQHIGNGPLWKVVDITLVQSCKDGWWSTLLYISQYVKQGHCVPQSWYLSIDMQLYLLAPLILIPLSRRPNLGLSILGVVILGGVMAPFVVGYVEDIGPSFLTADATFTNHYYFQTYTRFGPYVIGMMLGYGVFKIKSGEWKLRLNSIWIGIFWLVSLGVLAACLWASHDLLTIGLDDRLGKSLHLALHRQAWALGVCGVIFLCVLGHGGPIDWFLSLPIFQYVSRVSYSMYLVHYAIITIRFSAMRNSFFFSNVYMMHQFWADFAYTLVISVIFCLAFESPIIILEKHIFGRKARERVHEMKNCRRNINFILDTC